MTPDNERSKPVLAPTFCLPALCAGPNFNHLTDKALWVNGIPFLKKPDGSLITDHTTRKTVAVRDQYDDTLSAVKAQLISKSMA